MTGLIKPIVCVTLAALLCLTAACDANRLRQAATAADRMALLIKTGIDTRHELRQAGLIDAQEELAVTEALYAVNRSVMEFNARARTFDQWTPETRGTLYLLFLEISDGVKVLNDEGLLKIKNPRAREKLSLALAGINAAVSTIEEVFKDDR